MDRETHGDHAVRGPKNNFNCTRFWQKLSIDAEFFLWFFVLGSSYSFSFSFLVDVKFEINNIINDFSNSFKYYSDKSASLSSDFSPSEISSELSAALLFLDEKAGCWSSSSANLESSVSQRGKRTLTDSRNVQRT